MVNRKKSRGASQSKAGGSMRDMRSGFKVADWKCPYCSATNKHTHAKCQSCGAARAAKKDDAKK